MVWGPILDLRLESQWRQIVQSVSSRNYLEKYSKAKFYNSKLEPRKANVINAICFYSSTEY